MLDPHQEAAGPGITRILVDHFFRRFFDNDTLNADGDTQTTVIRALSIAAAPGLMVAFFLQNQYHWTSPWGKIEDRYFFVLISFVIMGAVSVFEWEMLFPDRLDFLVLSPLPIRPAQMLAAKAAALFAFMALFLVAGNLFGALLLPIYDIGAVVHQMFAHDAAVLAAGTFAAFFFLALGGILLCVLDPARFRIASPIVQMLSVMALALLLLHYVLYADSLQALLAQPQGAAHWMPPLWFLGLYERLLHGAAAPPFAQPMAQRALQATAIAALAALLTYPIAWARMRKLAMEGVARRRTRPARPLSRLLQPLVRSPGERAVFHFIGQTIARNNRYQVYLAMYCGTGLALAVACAAGLDIDRSGLHLALSTKGLHAILPLLLFWIVAGLRAAFAFPLNLPAAWVFRIAGVTVREAAAAARAWVLLCALTATAAILAALAIARWDPRHLLVQAVLGLCLSVLLTDGFFAFQQGVPFTRPRMPGRTSLPLMLTLYVGVLAPFIFGVIRLELALEEHPAKLMLLALTAAVLHAPTLLRSDSDDAEPEREEDQGEFQLLGLSG